MSALLGPLYLGKLMVAEVLDADDRPGNCDLTSIEDNAFGGDSPG